MIMKKYYSRAGAAMAFFLFALIYGAAIASAAPFYEGKTLTIVEGRKAGGTGSLRTQAVAKYLQKHLPGHPAIVYRFMSGGGGVAAANHMASMAEKDGFTIANIGTGVYSNAFLDTQGVRYDLDDFVFLGSASSGGPYTLIIRPELELDTVEKLKAYKGLRFAQRSVGHTMYILDRMFAYVLDLQNPQWVLGYNSREIELALERGEADAQSNNLHSFFRETPEWLSKGFTVPVIMKNTMGRGAEVAPRFPQDRPALEQYADSELERAVLKFHNNSRPGSSVFFAPKGVPAPALKALREAFDRVWKDPEFAQEYKRLTGEPADPITGREIEQALEQVPRDPKVMKIYKQIVGGGPLPSG
jgi:tripartite-type tricarboxylate transporter receptor subunit TctC